MRAIKYFYCHKNTQNFWYNFLPKVDNTAIMVLSKRKNKIKTAF